ncbi:PREDICTED: uncharacterized protein LOC106813246 [Priapulus caudatus]|uniref:Uncharacterized protein LOC106813246 n=1 Tax=Priapulus caudatus TaxID=37621 RepID=A0ABM1EKZ2_PRICU|nr:PREDICTED: uncharacterized protein LOC106813246 [Priapulus caudatus]
MAITRLCMVWFCYVVVLSLLTHRKSSVEGTENMHDLTLVSLGLSKHTMQLQPSESAFLRGKREAGFSLEDILRADAVRQDHVRDRRQVVDDCSSCIEPPIAMCESTTRTKFPTHLEDIFGSTQRILNIPGIFEQPVVQTICQSSSCNLVHGNCTQEYREQSLIIILPPSDKCVLSTFLIPTGCACRATIFPPT